MPDNVVPVQWWMSRFWGGTKTSGKNLICVSTRSYGSLYPPFIGFLWFIGVHWVFRKNRCQSRHLRLCVNAQTKGRVLHGRSASDALENQENDSCKHQRRIPAPFNKLHVVRKRSFFNLSVSFQVCKCNERKRSCSGRFYL